MWQPSHDPVATRVLTQGYGLNVRGLRLLRRESANQVYRADVDGGSVVVKRLARPGSASWRAFQARTMVRLRDQGFPVAPPVTATSGLPAAEAGGFWWQVLPFDPGRAFRSGDAPDVAAAADCLDRLHGFGDVDDVEPAASPVRDVESWLTADETELDRLTEMIDDVAPNTPDDVRKRYAATYERARSSLDMNAYRELPRGLSHGEFIGSNLLFQDDGVSCVLDWDALDVRPRVADLARACLFIARRERGKFDVHADLARAFLRDATASRGLGDDEAAAVVPYLELFFLPSRTHLSVIMRHNPEIVRWYLGWSAAGADSVRAVMTPIVDTL
ncbi:MAG: phosphotransferase [Stackebrandtia sp.]